MLYALQLASQGLLFVGVFVAGFLGGRLQKAHVNRTSSEEWELNESERSSSCLTDYPEPPHFGKALPPAGEEPWRPTVPTICAAEKLRK
jgi:nitrate/TMAO reductase-like tetraheme cytochrome c subunit